MGWGGPECDSSAQELVHLCPKAEYNWEISAGFRMQQNFSVTLDVTGYDRNFWVGFCAF